MYGYLLLFVCVDFPFTLLLYGYVTLPVDCGLPYVVAVVCLPFCVSRCYVVYVDAFLRICTFVDFVDYVADV